VAFWQYLGSGYLNPGDVLLAAGVEDLPARRSRSTAGPSLRTAVTSGRSSLRDGDRITQDRGTIVRRPVGHARHPELRDSSRGGPSRDGIRTGVIRSQPLENRGAGYYRRVPAGRPPSPLNPDASAAARLGAEIRSFRVARGFTLETLGRKVGFTAQHISAIEHALTACSRTFIERVDRALGAEGKLADQLEAVVIEQAFVRHDRANARTKAATVEDDVKRRAFMGLGLIAVLVGPDAAARALSELEGEQIASDWTREVATSSDRQALMPALRADLKRLAEQGGPQRATASLSVCAAMIALSGGDPASARRWWSRAHVAARAAGDRRLAAYVAGQHAYDGVYALYAPAQALTVADRAVAITHSPCAGRMHALGARARSLALLGRKTEARHAMRDVETAFERLPRDVTRRTIGAGWAEERLHHTRSFVRAFGGVGSPSSHDDALAADMGFWRDPPQIELHRAAAETDAAHAVATVSNLSNVQRSDHFIRLLGIRTVAAIESSGADARELRALLT